MLKIMRECGVRRFYHSREVGLVKAKWCYAVSCTIVCNSKVVGEGFSRMCREKESDEETQVLGSGGD